MTIAVAVDLAESGQAERILAAAEPWITRMGGPVDILHVEGPWYAFDWVSDPTVHAMMEQEAAQLRERDHTRLNTLLMSIPADQRGEVRILKGSAAKALIEAAQDYEAMLVATHGRTGMGHLWLGSVAEAVVRRSPCPVLVLRLEPPPDPS